MNTVRARRLVLLETVGSLCWFLMDGCWMLGLGGFARAFAVPTVVTQLVAFRYTDRSLVELAITGSVNCWVAMNVLWMFGDLEDRPGLFAAARVAFGAGLGLLVVAALRARSAAAVVRRALGRFRRLRVPMR
jgi:hypothetical protein